MVLLAEQDYAGTGGYCNSGGCVGDDIMKFTIARAVEYRYCGRYGTIGESPHCIWIDAEDPVVVL